MAGRLEGKVALVTGGASGIGRATALKFAQEGARVAIADIAVAGGEETAAKVNAMGAEAIFIKADISKQGEVKAMVERAVGRYGRLDCAFNNAGIGTGVNAAAIDKIDEEYWDRVIMTNLKGTWYCMKHEIPAMLMNPPKLKLPQGEYGRGVIVNASSFTAVASVPGSAAYQASKAAILQVMKAAALDYCRRGIRVMAVVPGVIRTPMALASMKGAGSEASVGSLAAMGRIGEPEEVAGPVVFLCSDEASYMTGSYIAVDGGALIPASAVVRGS